MGYSEKVKTKVLEAVKGGMTKTAAAKTFKVSEGTVQNWTKATKPTQVQTTDLKDVQIQRLAAANVALRNDLGKALLRLHERTPLV